MTAGVWRDGSNQIVTPSPNISLTSSVSLTITGTDILEFTNEFNTPLPIKRQYFYNKQNLDLYLEVSTTIRELGVYVPPITLPAFLSAYIPPANFIDILFNNISFWEVDMIPFFRYYKNSNNIDTRIKTPWYAVAPFIDYTDNEFDFIGNINLSIDSETVGNQANYSVVAAGSVDGSVQPPIQAGQVIL